MKALSLLATLSITIIAAQRFVPAETGKPPDVNRICDTACYNTYRYLMGVCNLLGVRD
ncbi:predicted protein [Plenodomus lingam JN3]|uniref:Uncharacterized protein n=1 Tax=Leptosphaeria maculans (strain JN3 / isolate v23.1.3 / race Av1-4-5-6-7-8) TaxID=985895 RepID=E5A6X5_LEPMJ|nr:predicted protein [Plenodomus lingam JN3]CBX99370.1 predicted protein [Plenodomus lingam JN3]